MGVTIYAKARNFFRVRTTIPVMTTCPISRADFYASPDIFSYVRGCSMSEQQQAALDEATAALDGQAGLSPLESYVLSYVIHEYSYDKKEHSRQLLYGDDFAQITESLKKSFATLKAKHAPQYVYVRKDFEHASIINDDIFESAVLRIYWDYFHMESEGETYYQNLRISTEPPPAGEPYTEVVFTEKNFQAFVTSTPRYRECWGNGPKFPLPLSLRNTPDAREFSDSGTRAINTEAALRTAGEFVDTNAAAATLICTPELIPISDFANHSLRDLVWVNVSRIESSFFEDPAYQIIFRDLTPEQKKQLMQTALATGEQAAQELREMMIDDYASTAAHELGHAFGFSHSDPNDCDLMNNNPDCTDHGGGFDASQRAYLFELFK